MSPAAAGDERARVLARFPAALRAFVEQELTLGNGIQYAGGGYPAPPIGGQVMLTGDLRQPPEALTPFRVRVRGSSINHLELTDGEGIFWVLTPPHPPPEPPDMDRIREASNTPSEATLAARRTPPDPLAERLEVDIRGEELVYHRDGRRAHVTWTYTRGHQIYRDSLKEWVGPARGEFTPIGPEEAEEVLRRIVELAAGHGIGRITIEA